MWIISYCYELIILAIMLLKIALLSLRQIY